MDPALKKDLRKIEGELNSIRKQSASSWKKVFFIGFIQGAGWVAGTVIALVLLGWLLSLAGLVPGLHEIVDSIQAAADRRF